MKYLFSWTVPMDILYKKEETSYLEQKIFKHIDVIF